MVHPARPTDDPPARSKSLQHAFGPDSKLPCANAICANPARASTAKVPVAKGLAKRQGLPVGHAGLNLPLPSGQRVATNDQGISLATSPAVAMGELPGLFGIGESLEMVPVMMAMQRRGEQTIYFHFIVRDRKLFNLAPILMKPFIRTARAAHIAMQLTQGRRGCRDQCLVTDCAKKGNCALAEGVGQGVLAEQAHHMTELQLACPFSPAIARCACDVQCPFPIGARHWVFTYILCISISRIRQSVSPCSLPSSKM